MSNVVDLQQYLNSKHNKCNFLEYARGTIPLLKGCRDELPHLSTGLGVVAASFEKYMYNDRIFKTDADGKSIPSYWDLACALSFSGSNDNDGVPDSITLGVLNGRAVESLDTDNVDAVRQGRIVLTTAEPMTAFGEFHNERPGLIYRSWLEKTNSRNGIDGLMSVNFVFFIDLLDEAYLQGFRTHELNIIEDELTLVLRSKTEQMTIVINYAVFRSTHNLLKRLSEIEMGDNQ